jgi:hypothetical protein
MSSDFTGHLYNHPHSFSFFEHEKHFENVSLLGLRRVPFVNRFSTSLISNRLMLIDILLLPHERLKKRCVWDSPRNSGSIKKCC